MREAGKGRRAVFCTFVRFCVELRIFVISCASEKEFRIQLDLADLYAEQITILGRLSRYVAELSYFRPESFPNSEEATG